MKVLVIGEKCFDIFVYGDVNRLSPEAPIPVLIPKNVVTGEGMGKNVVNNLISISFVRQLALSLIPESFLTWGFSCKNYFNTYTGTLYSTEHTHIHIYTYSNCTYVRRLLSIY